MNFNTIEEIIEDIRQGKMVIIVDDEDRENEGDLLMAASLVTPEDINFMARYGRGLICLTITEKRCEQLQLGMMVNANSAQHGTNFTISIEAAEGVTTGISAADRAMTIQTAVAAEAKPEDIVQPGHIFPLKAQPGGVLTRTGHTEAGCDLARMAGFEPAAVIVEILNEDGTMARRPDLEKYAKQHHLKMGSIADLIEYRLKNERTIEKKAECVMPTNVGDFHLHAFEDSITKTVHLALVKGTIDSSKPVLVRVHMHNTLCDILSSFRQECGWPLNDVMQRIDEEGSGVIVILNDPDEYRHILQQVKYYQSHDQGQSIQQRGKEDLYTYGIGAQILQCLNVKKMRVMSSPKKMHGLSGFGLEVVEYITGE